MFFPDCLQSGKQQGRGNRATLVCRMQGTDAYWILGFIGFQIFYLNKQLGILLVGLAHQLSFYLDLPLLLII